MADTFHNAHQAARALSNNADNLRSTLIRTQMLREYVVEQGYYTEETLPAILKEARDAELTQALSLSLALLELWETKLNAVTLS